MSISGNVCLWSDPFSQSEWAQNCSFVDFVDARAILQKCRYANPPTAAYGPRHRERPFLASAYLQPWRQSRLKTAPFGLNRRSFTSAMMSSLPAEPPVLQTSRRGDNVPIELRCKRSRILLKFKKSAVFH